jgi:hypothetical protein
MAEGHFERKFKRDGQPTTRLVDIEGNYTASKVKRAGTHKGFLHTLRYGISPA